MRLIDADELRAVRFHALPYTHIHALGAEPYSYELGWNDAIDAIIDNAPTVEPKHGHWVLVGFVGQGTRLSKCSICGRRTTYNGNFCAQCGAKMDEVEDEMTVTYYAENKLIQTIVIDERREDAE